MPENCVQLKSYRVALAPMEGVTDFPVRVWFHLFGAVQEMTTPFYRVSRGHSARIPDNWAPKIFVPEVGGRLRYRLTPQVMAATLDDCKRVASELQKDSQGILELNCGCPASRSVGRGAGSSLLRSVEDFQSFVRGLSGALGPGVLSVKMRLGYEDDSLFEDLIESIGELPLARIVIHGRTRPEGYRGEARWEAIQWAAQNAAVPVFGSGDIVDRASFEKRILLAPHVAGVFIGRGSLANPRIFGDLWDSDQKPWSPQLAYHSLRVLELLHRMFRVSLPLLLDAIREGLMDHAPETHQDWENCYNRLNTFVRSQVASNRSQDQVLDPCRFSLGRLKMIWLHLSRSLSSTYHNRDLLRAPSAEVFFSRFLQINQALEAGRGTGVLNEMTQSGLV